MVTWIVIYLWARVIVSVCIWTTFVCHVPCVVGTAGGGSDQTYADDPPPYPGKMSRTNINYLPSYNSALQMSSLSGGQAEETTNRPEGIRKDQNETSLTVLSLSANGSQLAIPVTEEPRTISPVRHNSRLQSITEENTPRLPVIEVSDVSSESRSPAVFMLWCAAKSIGKVCKN